MSNKFQKELNSGYHTEIKKPKNINIRIGKRFNIPIRININPINKLIIDDGFIIREFKNF